MKKITILLVVIMVFLVLSGLGIFAKEQVWEFKIGNKVNETHPESQGILKFIELVDERSKGRIKITPYFGEILGPAKIQLENVITGVQDFYSATYTFLASYVPEFRVHSLPYLFENYEEYQKFLLSPIEKNMEEKLIEKVGLRVLNEKKNWRAGAYRVIASKKPIKSIDDIKGLKLRQPDNQTTIKTWTALGANVAIISFSETYLALQQGMVDALTTTLEGYYVVKFYELAKHITKSNEYQQQLCIVMNESRFQSLPQDLQEVIIESINDAGVLVTQLIEDKSIEIENELKNKHGVQIHVIDLEPLKEKTRTIHDELEASGFIPAGIIDQINDYLAD